MRLAGSICLACRQTDRRDGRRVGSRESRGGHDKFARQAPSSLSATGGGLRGDERRGRQALLDGGIRQLARRQNPGGLCPSPCFCVSSSQFSPAPSMTARRRRTAHLLLLVSWRLLATQTNTQERVEGESGNLVLRGCLPFCLRSAPLTLALWTLGPVSGPCTVCSQYGTPTAPRTLSDHIRRGLGHLREEKQGRVPLSDSVSERDARPAMSLPARGIVDLSRRSAGPHAWARDFACDNHVRRGPERVAGTCNRVLAWKPGPYCDYLLAACCILCRLDTLQQLHHAGPDHMMTILSWAKKKKKRLLWHGRAGVLSAEADMPDGAWLRACGPEAAGARVAKEHEHQNAPPGGTSRTIDRTRIGLFPGAARLDTGGKWRASEGGQGA